MTDGSDDNSGGSSNELDLEADHHQNNREQETLGRKENRAVAFLRLVVMALLLGIATLVSLGVYFYSRQDERDDFHYSFSMHATQLSDSFSDAVERKLGALGTLSNTVTSYAEDTSSTFPFVTVSHFAVRGSDVRVLADALIIHWSPMVTEENRREWEEYALNNRFRINEAYEQDTQLTKEQDDYFAKLLLDSESMEHVNENEHGDDHGQNRDRERRLLGESPGRGQRGAASGGHRLSRPRGEYRHGSRRGVA